MPVMMKGPSVRQLWWEDLVYASYDEWTYCMAVIMRAYCTPVMMSDLLYASYDEIYVPVIMRGPIRQLWWEDLVYASYDEKT